jgi:hypothetical protein
METEKRTLDDILVGLEPSEPIRRIGFTDKSGNIFYIIGIDEKGRVIIHNEETNCYYAGCFYPTEPPEILNTSVNILYTENELAQQLN